MEFSFWLNTVWIWIVGAIIGSFLNVIIFRYDHEGMSVLKPSRSFCPSCNRTLVWYENIPIISFLLLKGRCRTCHDRISPRYLFIEILTPALIWLNFCVFQFGWEWVGVSLITVSLLVVFFIDLQTSTISDWNWIFVGVGSFIVALSRNALVYNAIVATVVFGLFLLVYWFYRGRFGMGDVLLIAAASLGLGMVGITMTILVASIAGLVFAALQKKKMKDAIPFGPFLAIGIYISLIIADRVFQMMVYP